MKLENNDYSYAHLHNRNSRLEYLSPNQRVYRHSFHENLRNNHQDIYKNNALKPS